MIDLIYPDSVDRRYVVIESCLFGPFTTTAQPSETTIKCSLDDGKFSERRGILGENHVIHDKIEGKVVYQTPLLALQNIPEGIFIQRLTGYGFERGLSRLQNISMGLAVPEHVFVTIQQTTSEGRRLRQFRGYRQLNGEWHVWTLWVYEDTFDRPTSWSHVRYYGFTPDIRSGYPVIYCNKEEDYCEGPLERSGVDWYTSVSIEALVSFKDDFGRLPRATVVQTGLWGCVLTFNGIERSPAELKIYMHTLIDSTLANIEFPLSEIDYGILAYRAVDKISANSVNMLELLKDLRHPLQLIPKLRNLNKLKTWANNYLTYEFGIAPTVSDLETIVAAFTRIKPYLDKNGFSTYNAAEDQTAGNHYGNYRLEQRVKLAIGTEDNELSALCERLDNLGAFPRLENIWDLIPFSFVVDWFVDVGGFLERIDTNLRLLQLPIKYVTSSYKSTTELLLGITDVPLTGYLQQVHYHRWVSDQCPAPPAALQLSSDLYNHSIDGGMLLIQHRK